MMLKTGMEVGKYCNIFNYVPQIPQKGLKSNNITIVSVPGVKLTPTFILPSNYKGGVRQEKHSICTDRGQLVNFIGHRSE